MLKPGRFFSLLRFALVRACGSRSAVERRQAPRRAISIERPPVAPVEPNRRPTTPSDASHWRDPWRAYRWMPGAGAVRLDGREAAAAGPNSAERKSEKPAGFPTSL